MLTVVHAAHMVYTEENRLAVYTGGVTLERPNLKVKSRDIARLPGGIERGFAAGQGVCRWRGGDPPDVAGAESRTTGTAEHSEYYTADRKVILTGGLPKMVDSRGNTTIGPAD